MTSTQVTNAADSSFAPAEGFVVTHFLVVADQDHPASSTGRYSARTFCPNETGHLEGGQQLAHPQRGRRPDRGQAHRHPDHPGRPLPGERLSRHPGGRHRRRLPGLVGQGRALPDRAQAQRAGDPSLHPRSRRAPHRGRPDHWPWHGHAATAGVMTNQATFVLVHGSWQGAWSCDGVRDRLRARGHRVIAPALPGRGGIDEDRSWTATTTTRRPCSPPWKSWRPEWRGSPEWGAC